MVADTVSRPPMRFKTTRRRRTSSPCTKQHENMEYTDQRTKPLRRRTPARLKAGGRPMRTKLRMKLSSGTWFVKGVCPAFSVFILVMFVLALLVNVPFEGEQGGGIVVLACLFVLNVFAFYFAIKTKDVWVEKDHLIVKGAGKEERIDLADIERVTGWPLGRYRPVWVTFSKKTAFGQSIVFFGGYYFFDIGRNHAAEALRKIVARRKAKTGAVDHR